MAGEEGTACGKAEVKEGQGSGSSLCGSKCLRVEPRDNARLGGLQCSEDHWRCGQDWGRMESWLLMPSTLRAPHAEGHVGSLLRYLWGELVGLCWGVWSCEHAIG